MSDDCLYTKKAGCLMNDVQHKERIETKVNNCILVPFRRSSVMMVEKENEQFSIVGHKQLNPLNEHGKGYTGSCEVSSFVHDRKVMTEHGADSTRPVDLEMKIVLSDVTVNLAKYPGYTFVNCNKRDEMHYNQENAPNDVTLNQANQGTNGQEVNNSGTLILKRREECKKNSIEKCSGVVLFHPTEESSASQANTFNNSISPPLHLNVDCKMKQNKSMTPANDCDKINKAPPKNFEINKHAQIAQGETLENMTVDSITSSSLDEPGNIVSPTIKNYVPDDPKLLWLQDKIAYQKEKYIRAYSRERRRKAQITSMEFLLKEKISAQLHKHQKTSESFQNSSLFSQDGTLIPLTSNNYTTSVDCISSSDELRTFECAQLDKELSPAETSHEQINYAIQGVHKSSRAKHNKTKTTKMAIKSPYTRLATLVSPELHEVCYSEKILMPKSFHHKKKKVKLDKMERTHVSNINSSPIAKQIFSRCHTSINRRNNSLEKVSSKLIVSNLANKIQKIDMGKKEKALISIVSEAPLKTQSQGVQTTPRFEAQTAHRYVVQDQVHKQKHCIPHCEGVRLPSEDQGGVSFPIHTGRNTDTIHRMREMQKSTRRNKKHVGGQWSDDIRRAMKREDLFL